MGGDYILIFLPVEDIHIELRFATSFSHPDADAAKALQEIRFNMRIRQCSTMKSYGPQSASLRFINGPEFVLQQPERFVTAVVKIFLEVARSNRLVTSLEVATAFRHFIDMVSQVAGNIFPWVRISHPTLALPLP